MSDGPDHPTGTPAESIDNRETDLYAEVFCESCETSAAIEETDIGRDTKWLKATCECGETAVHARVCPWPRDGMVLDGEGDWRFPDRESQP